MVGWLTLKLQFWGLQIWVIIKGKEWSQEQLAEIGDKDKILRGEYVKELSFRKNYLYG